MKARQVAIGISLLLGASQAARAEAIDRIVSVVGDRVITASDVGFEVGFAAHDVSPLPPFEQGDPLQRLEDYRILRALAGDVDAFQPRAEDVEARLEAFKLSWALRRDFEAFLLRWGMDEAALREQLYARLVVERYVIRNLGFTPDDLVEPERYVAKYEAWMQRRRGEVTVRRVEPIPPPESPRHEP